jgi:uncharacterized protein (DUF1684 family)
MDGDTDPQALADWRRTIATLYADVRYRAVTDPAEAWEHWRTTRERLYREHPQSPVPEAERAAFEARHWSYDPMYRFEIEVEPASEEGPGAGPGAPPAAGLAIALPNSGQERLAFRRIGLVRVPFPDGPRRQSLTVFWMAGYAGGLFLPFRDTTNGRETYGAGRYLLDAAKSADLGGDLRRRTLILDFNFAYQPSCAFDPKWACPLAPPENHLEIPVRAGERLA